MKPRFEIDALKQFLAEKLGVSIVSCTMITACSRPENFRVTTAAGDNYVVKCALGGIATDSFFYKHSLVHLQELQSVKSVVRLVAGPWEFLEHSVIVLRCLPGRNVRVDALNLEQERALIHAYSELSDAMQQVSHVRPYRDSLKTYQELLAKLREHPTCEPLLTVLENKISEAQLTYDERRLKVIHGDLHHGNMLFEGNELSGFIDFEDIRYGYPAEDWVRYVVCGEEHMAFCNIIGHKRAFACFKRLLPLAKADEWHVAINELLMKKIENRIRKRGYTTFMVKNLLFRIKFYLKLHALVDKHFGTSI
jgi:Ser/Thr protein kinase RdoA (MazF antagonist)